MGLNCDLTKLFSFIYKEKLDDEMTEYEYDHVFIGISDNEPVINIFEVVDWKRISFNDLNLDIIENPYNYTFWFKEIYKNVNDHLLNSVKSEL